MRPSMERLVSCGPVMNTMPEQELAEREIALEEAKLAVVNNGLSESSVSKLRELVRRRANACRRAIHGDPHTRVEPGKVQFKHGAEAVKARLCAHSPVKMVWLARCMVTIVALGLVCRKWQAV